MLVKSEKGTDFWLEEYSGGFRVSRNGYLPSTLFLEEVMEAVKSFLAKRGREIPETDNLLVVGDGYYTMNFKTWKIIPGEGIDKRPLRRLNFGLFPGDR